MRRNSPKQREVCMGKWGAEDRGNSGREKIREAGEQDKEVI